MSKPTYDGFKSSGKIDYKKDDLVWWKDFIDKEIIPAKILRKYPLSEKDEEEAWWIEYGGSSTLVQGQLLNLADLRLCRSETCVKISFLCRR